MEIISIFVMLSNTNNSNILKMEQSIKSKGHTIEIVQDCDAESPRTYESNVGKMVCFHNRYNLGDTENDYDVNDFINFMEMENKIVAFGNVCIIPLYLYDHGGITISTEPFSCKFDSGQIGFIYAKKETVREMYGIKRITKKILERVEADLRAEVKTYDDYLTGEVYGYEIYDKDGDMKDISYGYIGDPETSGCIENAKSILESL